MRSLYLSASPSYQLFLPSSDYLMYFLPLSSFSPVTVPCGRCYSADNKLPYTSVPPLDLLLDIALNLVLHPGLLSWSSFAWVSYSSLRYILIEHKDEMALSYLTIAIVVIIHLPSQFSTPTPTIILENFNIPAQDSRTSLFLM